MTPGPSIQWCESYSEFLVVPPLIMLCQASLCAPAYITHSAQTASHILYTTGKLPPFNKQEDRNADNQVSTYSCMLDEM